MYQPATAIFVAMAVAAAALGQVSDAPPTSNSIQISMEAFAKGRYTIVVCDKVKPDADSRGKVLEFGQWLGRQEALFAELDQTLGEGSVDQLYTREFWRSHEHSLAQMHLSLCQQTAGSTANLTAVLMTGASALDWPTGTTKPVFDALSSVTTNHPSQWQAKLAPLLMAQLLVQKTSPELRDASALAAAALLQRTLPPKQFRLDIEDAEVKAIRQRYLLTPPLRASYLASLLAIQYNAGTVSTTPSKVRQWFADAEKTGAQIIAEFPDTPHAAWAKDLINNQIPILRAELLP
jgi:hypothetical protein